MKIKPHSTFKRPVKGSYNSQELIDNYLIEGKFPKIHDQIGKLIKYHALDVLSKIEPKTDNPYVICGKLEGGYITDFQKPWRRIRKRADLNDVRIHDLRHSFASFAVGNQESLPMIGKLLGHTQVQTTARYAHLADAPMHEAADRVSNSIAKALTG